GDAWQPPALLLFAADPHDRGRHRRHAERQHVCAGALQLVDEDPLFEGGAPDAAVFLRPGDAPPTTVAQLQYELLRESAPALVAGLAQLIEERCGKMLGHKSADLVAPGALLRGQVVAHDAGTYGKPPHARKGRPLRGHARGSP